MEQLRKLLARVPEQSSPSDGFQKEEDSKDVQEASIPLIEKQQLVYSIAILRTLGSKLVAGLVAADCPESVRF